MAESGHGGSQASGGSEHKPVVGPKAATATATAPPWHARVLPRQSTETTR